jgi:hypothetical protein
MIEIALSRLFDSLSTFADRWSVYFFPAPAADLER